MRGCEGRADDDDDGKDQEVRHRAAYAARGERTAPPRSTGSDLGGDRSTIGDSRAWLLDNEIHVPAGHYFWFSVKVMLSLAC